LAFREGSIEDVISSRGHVATGVGDAVKVTLDVATTAPLAFDVAVKVSVSAVLS
jgi:hypothetical protein